MFSYTGRLHGFFASSNSRRPRACSTMRGYSPSFTSPTDGLKHMTYRLYGCVILLWSMALTCHRRFVHFHEKLTTTLAKCTPLSPPCLSVALYQKGRFGIGFNSVYHLTELPAFVSATKWCSFDPQAKFLPNVNPSNPGKMVDFLKHRETVGRYPDQVETAECCEWDVLGGYFCCISRLGLWCALFFVSESTSRGHREA